ncbi:MAG: SpoIID/LytB domain-containing protein [Spirochaetia bacterium]|jgi:SpoIID/LytB domain protein|nr:SpoIID/LytB domain-containing protein [Spirochaetia bacterium]
MGVFRACVFLAVFFLFSCASRHPAGGSGVVGGESPASPRTEGEAVRAYYGGDVEGSIGMLEGLLRQGTPYGGEGRIRKELAFAYHETGGAGKAAAVWEDVFASDGGGGEARREEFVALCLAGDTRRALDILPLVQPETSETLFYEALLRRDSGDPQKAEELLRRSLGMQENRPIGWFFLGEILAPSFPARAEECYKKALSQDAGFTFALFPLAEALFSQKRYREAYGFFRRAYNSYPDHPGISSRIEEILRLLPELAHQQQAAARKRKNDAVPPTVKALGGEAGNLPLVRVGLAENLASLYVKTGGTYTLYGGNSSYAGKALEQLFFEISDGTISVKDSNGKIVLASRDSLALTYRDAGSTTIVFDFLSEAGSFFALTEDRAYRGGMELRPQAGGMTLINSLNIEEYLYSVVPSEMPASWPEEALKAQAIAHRSYALAHLGQYAAKGFDVYGSVVSAAYRGAGGEAARTTAAVDSSRGLYLTAGGKPLKAYYSANHGGYSEDSVAVWGGDDAFMAAVPDKLIPPREQFLPLDELDGFIRGRPASYCAVEKLHSPAAYRWEKWVSAEDIKNRIAAEGKIGRVLRVTSRGRGISGRIREVEITGTEGSLRVVGDRIRSRLGGLRSNLFSIRSKAGKDGTPEYFIFQGAGWGHGVGLDQSGAAGMARAGYSAEEILMHYYPRAAITRQPLP